jgi:hypothetical protein
MKRIYKNEIETAKEPFYTGDAVMKSHNWKLTTPALGNWPDGNEKYILAEEIEEIGTQIIQTYRSDLQNINIGYVFKRKAPKTDGNIILGQIKAENDLQKVLHGYDAVVIIGFDTWQTLDNDGKFRLVHHELEHLVRDEESGKIGTIKHNVEEFNSTIKIFGPNQISHVAFIEGYQKFNEKYGNKK